MKHCIILITILSSTLIFNAQNQPHNMVKKMGRGINLGNVLSAPVEGNWSPIVMQQYFTDVAAAGFTNVRIPMDFFGVRTTGDTSVYSATTGTSGSYSGTFADYVVNSAYLDRIEEVIGWGLSEGLVVILDFHGADLKSEFLNRFHSSNTEYTNPTSARRAADNQKFRAIWTQVADRFKNHSENLLFEIINEPYFEMNEAEMNTLNTDILAIIRNSGGSNATRNVIITGGGANSHEAPLQISPSIIANDSYLIATFHYYQPFNFTSSSTDSRDEESWGTTGDKSTLTTRFEEVLTWSNANNIPVFVGEFGADNTGGYKYSTGDLNTISGNTTGYADGGPDNASRLEYHRYIAEQAINRGFSFSVWDSGPKSNKTVHMRQDNSSSVNYNIANFSVNTYSPKSTNISTVIDASIWVEDVKNALFSSGTWPLCYGPTENLVLNPGFECGINTNWSFNVSGVTAAATYNDATTDAKDGLVGAKIDVTTEDEYNKVILSNDAYKQDLTGKKITIKTFAKSLASNGQSFKIRIKAVINGSNAFIPSTAFSLTNVYPINPFEFEYIVPNNTTSIQVQIMLGNFSGIYFLDDFETIIEDNKTTWSGATSTDWAINTNWSNGVPINSLDAYIPSNVNNYPVISETTEAAVNNLDINSGASLTVSSGGSLIVSGTSTGNLTYNVGINDTNWHLISSPVVGEQYNDDNTTLDWVSVNNIATGTNSNLAIGTYNNGTPDTNTGGSDTETGHWRYFQAGGVASTFNSGTGYQMKRSSGTNYGFTGTYKTDDLLKTINQDVNNWNLVGNPYPSYLLVSEIIGDNATNLTDSHTFIYVWNNDKTGGAGYETLAGSDYILPGQAFFVNAKNSTTNNFTITEARQKGYQTGNPYKTSSSPKVKLFVQDSKRKLEYTDLEFTSIATTSLDKGLDAGTFTGVSSDFSIYSHLVNNSIGVNFMKQVLPDTNLESMIIPIGIKADAGEITFYSEASNLPTGFKVFLEDRNNTIFTRLDEANTTYKVTVDAGITNGRFYLHTKTSAVLSLDTDLLNSVSIFKASNNTLKITGLQKGKTTVALYNLLGKQVMTTSFEGANVNTISLPKFATGIYVVKLLAETGELNKKIILE